MEQSSHFVMEPTMKKAQQNSDKGCPEFPKCIMGRMDTILDTNITFVSIFLLFILCRSIGEDDQYWYLYGSMSLSTI